jgi:hypothetical protein
MPDRRIEVMNASARLYSTGQLYNWYIDEIAAYQPDLVVYYFNINHPRRTITFHESGKAPSLSQPVFKLTPEGELDMLPTEPTSHSNDMIFLNEEGDCVREAGRTDRSFHRHLLNWSHIYTALDDWRQGQVELRQFKDRKEIKDIERRQFRSGSPDELSELPYQWQVVAALLKEWSTRLKALNTPFIVMSHLAYYCTRGGALFDEHADHPWGFAFEEIPERRYLSFLAERLGFTYVDSFSRARQERCETDTFYVHPRYAYLNEAGTDWHAAILSEAIRDAT